MKANELRIGNLIQTDEGIETVIGITDEFIDCVLNGASGDYHIDDLYFNPIPLTEEWLLKFGFVKRYEDCFEYGEFILNDEFIIMDIDITVKCKHVHQLQNLYYALTEEELNELPVEK